jgi:hypothetical protein
MCNAAHLQSQVLFLGVVAGVGVRSVGVDEMVVVIVTREGGDMAALQHSQCELNISVQSVGSEVVWARSQAKSVGHLKKCSAVKQGVELRPHMVQVQPTSIACG